MFFDSSLKDKDNLKISYLGFKVMLVDFQYYITMNRQEMYEEQIRSLNSQLAAENDGDFFSGLLGDKPLNDEEAMTTKKSLHNFSFAHYIHEVVDLPELKKSSSERKIEGEEEIVEVCGQNSPRICLKTSTYHGKKKPICRKNHKYLQKYVFNVQNFHLKTTKIQFPKLLIRLFCSYFQQFSAQPHPVNISLVQQFMSKGRNDHNLKSDVRKLMGFSEERFDQKLNYKNRKIMYKILEKHLKEEVVLNSRLQANRLSYMMCAKVYRLRCRNRLANKCEYR